MTPQYHVLSIGAEHVEPQAVAVWMDSLHPAGDMARKLVWFYNDAPAGPGKLWLLLASDPGAPPRPVGGMGFGVRHWQLGGHIVRAGLMADLAVVRDHRTVRPALTLARSVIASMRESVGLGYGFPNRSAVGVLRRAGCRNLGIPVRYALVLRHGRYVPRVVRSQLAAELAAKALDLGGAGLVSWRARREAQSWRIVWLEALDSRFDRLWECARGDYRTVGQRDAAFLTWRFLRHPWHNYQIAAVCPRSTDERLVGYAAVEWVEDVVHVRDLFAERAHLGTVLDLLVPALARRGAVAVTMACLDKGLLAELLRWRRFISRGPGSPVVVDPSQAANDDLLDPMTWYLTDADEDT